MSNDQEPPPDFGADDGDSKIDESMYVSAISPNTVDVSLSGEEEEDEDDDNPFGEAPPRSPRKKTPTNTINTVESSTNDENNLFQQSNTPIKVDDDDDDLFKANNNPSVSTVPAQVPTVVPQSPPSTPKPQESQSSSRPTTFDSQTSSSISVSKKDASETDAESKPAQKRSNEGEIEITVSDPTKVGDGMSSYMTYRITTKTTLSIFKKSEFSVSRRFSDFLGLHAKVVHKYLHLGVIIPIPPEKDSIGMAKVKISKEDAIPTDFIDRRRALLERYLNRLARHDKIIEDTDVREFLEMPNDLPKSKDTVALSGAGVLRAFSSISNSVKLSTKTGEQDQWYEEKHTSVVELQAQLKHVYNQLNALFTQRKEAGHALKQFATSLNHLATNEEHPSLSSALTELANLEEKLDQINNEHSYKEYSILTELVKEYISLLYMVQLAFNQRIKVHQQWLNAEDTLRKAREKKTKLEQNPKSADKIPQAELEIRDGELKVESGKEEFEKISTTIKEEVETFEQTRIDDFKKGIDDYLKNLLEQQEKILQLWEGYLPEANKITV